MTSDKVGRVQTHFNSLDDKLSSGLRESMSSKSSVEPNTSPPCSVRLVVFELSREEDGDEDLEDTSLDGHGGNDTQDGVRSFPKFKEPEELEESDHSDHGTKVGNGSHSRTELCRLGIKLSSV